MSKIHKIFGYALVFFLMITGIASSEKKVSGRIVGVIVNISGSYTRLAQEEFRKYITITRGGQEQTVNGGFLLRDEDEIIAKGCTIKIEINNKCKALLKEGAITVTPDGDPYVFYGTGVFEDCPAIDGKVGAAIEEGTKVYIARSSVYKDPETKKIPVKETSEFVVLDGAIALDLNLDGRMKKTTDDDMTVRKYQGRVVEINGGDIKPPSPNYPAKNKADEISQWVMEVERSLGESPGSNPASVNKAEPPGVVTVDKSAALPAGSSPIRSLELHGQVIFPTASASIPLSFANFTIASIHIGEAGSAKLQSAIVESKSGRAKSAFRNMKLEDGDQIMTRDASVILEADNGRLFYLLRNQTHIQLKQGRLYLVSGDAYYSDSANAKIYAAEQWVSMKK